MWTLAPGQARAGRVDDRGHRHELLLDHVALAGDVADDLDGRAVGRDDAGRLRGREHERVDDAVEGRGLGAIDGRLRGGQLSDELVDVRLERGVVAAPGPPEMTTTIRSAGATGSPAPSTS